MLQSTASFRPHLAPSRLTDVMRAIIVTGCALALVLAGPVVPF